MTASLLTLNSSKTEFLLIGLKKNNLTRHTTPHSTPPTLLATLMNTLLSPTKFQPSPNPAITILDSFVVSVLTSTSTIATSIVHFKLDYCNSLHYNLPESQISRFQQIQNYLVRAVVKAPKSCYITSILRSFHWLKITERIEYKLLSLTYKVLTTTQPPYLHNLISVQPPRNTRSSSLITLARPPAPISSLLRITDRSFRYASPCLWNQLPSSLRQPHSSPSLSDLPFHAQLPVNSPLSPSITPSLFHSRLKTYVFHKSFPPYTPFLASEELTPRTLYWTVSSEHLGSLLLVSSLLFLFGSVRQIKLALSAFGRT